MAREVSDIKKSMTDVFINDISIKSLYGLTPGKTFEQEFSKMSLESILFYVFALCAWAIENLFDLHKSEVQAMVDTRAHKPQWYKSKALQFRLGQSLVSTDETDYYDNTGLTEEDIEAMQIVKQCAVNETDEPKPRLIVKVATITSGNLSPIAGTADNSATDLGKVYQYLKTIKDAGVKIECLSNYGDRLYFNLKVFVDPNVISTADGSLIRNASVFPVNAAIDEFIKNEIPFNGELVLASLVDKLQKIEGVKIPHIVSAESSWNSPSGWSVPATIYVKKMPESGYFVIQSLTVQYVV